ncbi:SIMPL domain-containing protein [Heyndrickxia sporothermodurans]
MYSSYTPYQDPLRRSSPIGQRNILKVSGEGILFVPPDIAIVNVGAITESKNIVEAQEENAKMISTVRSSLINLGIPNENIKTVDYRIDIEYDYENGKQTMRGYKVTHLLQIIIKQISQTGPIIDTAVRNGANFVSTIHFTVSKPQDYYHQAISLALENVQKKAETIVNSLGLSLHPIPIKITEIPPSTHPIPYQPIMYAKSEGTMIQPGQSRIKAEIEAEYIYFS